jgi:hypothetical protein
MKKDLKRSTMYNYGHNYFYSSIATRKKASREAFAILKLAMQEIMEQSLKFFRGRS